MGADTSLAAIFVIHIHGLWLWKDLSIPHYAQQWTIVSSVAMLIFAFLHRVFPPLLMGHVSVSEGYGPIVVRAYYRSSSSARSLGHSVLSSANALSAYLLTQFLQRWIRYLYTFFCDSN